ncbi:MAG: HopJ type III effector protein [Pseudomonadota bacterium]|nr:HopJ type III effector protein [Pseudomonadota bacterium]
MNIDEFILKLTEYPELIEFSDTMDVIDDNYEFIPAKFTNNGSVNEENQNNGSCKIFAFGLLNSLSKQQTLACFGSYYRDDVLVHPEGDDHQNIRNFIHSGWDGIHFSSAALIPN